MAPPNPKRPPRRPGPPVDPRKKTELELPFDDAIEPLRADDPAPQHVPQFPSTSRKAQVLRAPADDDDESTSALPHPGRYRTPVEMSDEPLPPRFGGADLAELAEPGFSAASLYVERGPGIGQLAPVRQGTMLIGRASAAQLRLQHPSISRRHSQITRRGERFFVKDLGSQNGTYVNQVRIDREVELFPGDELVLGTSQIRLRGPNGVTLETATRSRPDLQPRRRQGPSMLAIAVASGAVGIGLATVIIFVVFKFLRGPSYEQVPAPVAVITAPAGTIPPPARSALPASVAQAPAQVTDGAPKQDLTPPAPAAQAAPPPPQEPATAPRRTTPRPSPKPAAKPAPKVVAAAEEPSDPAVMARYETGNVAAALELARKRGLDGIASRLARFQAEYDAGQRALSQQDEPTAMKRLQAALSLDEQIGGGWGKYNAELRKQLSGLYTLAAGRQAKAGDVATARKSLATALRFDPENSAARAELDKLGAAPARSKASEIDAAFGD